MTNEEAIKILKEVREEVLAKETELSRQVFENLGIKAIDLAIKVLEQTRWIPCFDRLPEDYIHVLCQFTLGGMGECYLAHGVFHVVGGLVMTCNEVIAWMPRPQPYEVESEDAE